MLGKDLLSLPLPQVIGKFVIDSQGKYGCITNVFFNLKEGNRIVASFLVMTATNHRPCFILVNEPIYLLSSAPLYGRAWLHLARVTRRILEKQGCL